MKIGILVFAFFFFSFSPNKGKISCPKFFCKLYANWGGAKDGSLFLAMCISLKEDAQEVDLTFYLKKIDILSN